MTARRAALRRLGGRLPSRTVRSGAGATATPSLRARVSATVLGLFALLLLLIVVLVDVALGAGLRRDLDARVADRVAQAQQLAQGGAGPAELVAQLQGRDIRVRVRSPDGTSYGDAGLTATGPTTAAPALVGGPPAPPPGGPPRPPGGPGGPPPPPATSTTVTRTLPDGSQLVLVGDTTAITDVRHRLRLVMGLAAALALGLAAAALAAAVGVALRPLEHMTTLAQRITAGDRGTRLVPDRPRSDLGRAAEAFDGMLDALEDAETRARAAADQTRRFLADAAHELRTPLAGIQALAETITSRAVPTGEGDQVEDRQRREHLARLLMHETRQAARLVSDLLDLARIDEGLALQRTEVDLADLAATETDRARMLAPALAITLTGRRPLPVRADPVRIAQILANLLDNARRHTPSGGHISIELATTDGGAAGEGSQATVTITNSGAPIPEPDRERIFDRLVRLQDARDRESGGAGLGLAIARGLARTHHGELTCLAIDNGAAFRLTLPTSAAPPTPELPL